MLRAVLILFGFVLASPGGACETALVLAVDVSGSISNDEYILQMQGLAEALQDPAIVAALIGGNDALAVIHWSGHGKQRVSVPWTPLHSVQDVANLSALVRTIKRPKDHTDTAIGEALMASLALLQAAPDCLRRVIDLSGDGTENAGGTLAHARAEVEAQGITLNGIAIERDGLRTDIGAYFREFVISTDGFMMRAGGLADYPRAIRAKLLRELTKLVS